MTFADREDAGRQLADQLEYLRGEPVMVVGLPRGGVPVAAQVARKLNAPLDVIIVRKLGVPFQPELAMGAVGEDGVVVTSPDVIAMAGVSSGELMAIEERERARVAASADRYRAGRPRLDLTGRIAVVVDDGIATGSTARAACEIARAHGAARVVLAVPVAPRGWQERIGGVADEFACVLQPAHFLAIGEFYEDFSQTTDQQVTASLRAAADPAGQTAEVEPLAGTTRLAGYLNVPPGAPGIVIFAHGSGSSRDSPRNQYVAAMLAAAGLGTLLFDLLTPAEEADRANVFDISLLASRLEQVTAWLRAQRLGEPIGYFGASTGAAAGLTWLARGWLR